MILYLDTSALLKKYFKEEGSKAMSEIIKENQFPGTYPSHILAAFIIA